ncbi:long-chain-fatty-acid--CoA ligase [Brevibacillus invocatus]|uniref:long-chain-fatty-acid--CoA ligase n=1 Tax=Brevibacillus invocatus TaxID=173959 RepID=UPI00204038CF|nr:long-chain fatty acid--CoA ligase [Brevibacillus invocatus]MCM3078241.1 long-chain fatty acid--CoA ligase [Brevibacillus invocatus]MCM3428174.1 long-chain fatty acid--CoA ligase [Brevibacillus invocatus]
MKRPWHQWYLEGVLAEVEIPSISLYQLLERSAQDYPNRPAVIDGDREWSYAELRADVDFLAAAMYSRGIRKGERVAIAFPNSAEYILTYYAVHRLGGIVVQVNPMYQTHELDYLLKDSEASWFVGNREQAQKLEKIDLKQDLGIIWADPGDESENSLYGMIKEKRLQLPPLEIQPQEDLAVLQYTGGTTGRAKGVMLTHANLVGTVYQGFTFGGGVRKVEERILGMPPLYHVYGMSRMNGTMFNAQAYICLPRYDVNTILQLIRKHRPTGFPAVPTVYISLLNHPDLKPGDLDCIVACGSGSAPLPAEVMQSFEKKTGVPIIEGYGLSETSPATHVNPSARRKPGSIGIPLPNTDSKIVDMETGLRELPPGEPGELIIKGPQVMKGYWKKPEETAAVMRDGWFYTGDMATMDEEGYFYIVGRKKELIISSGFNVYPIEVEEVIYQHPAVAEAVVYGVPDSYRGETVKAAIVPRLHESVTEEEIIAWCSERLARYKVPKIIEFRTELPKTTVGKILRRTLMEEDQQRRLAQGGEAG